MYDRLSSDYDVDGDYNYVGSEGIQKRIARLTDYSAIVALVEGYEHIDKYDINVYESGLTIRITLSPKAKVR